MDTTKPAKPPKRLAGGQVIQPGHTWGLHHITIPDEDLDEALTSPHYLSNYVNRVSRYDEIIFKTRSSGWRVHAEIIGLNQHLATIELEEYSRHQRRAATIGTSDAESMFPIVDNGLDGFSLRTTEALS